MTAPVRGIVTAALAVVLLALFLGHLTDPGALLATRDIPIFHLPLRTALQQVVQSGLPTWNPLIHGGQPILSNPNYAAFYPPTWLLLAVPVHTSISLIVLLHAALAFAGARRFAIHLGCTPGPAMMAGIGFAFGGTSLASTSLLNLFCGLAWMPWILYGCDRWTRNEPTHRSATGLVLPVSAFSLQILAGEPVVVLITGLAAGAFALAARDRGVRTFRLALICTLVILLAAVQLLPTIARVADSPRGSGLEPDDVLEWSTPPQRLIELLWPRAWGDPMRIDEDLYFGWSVHDRQFPYLYSIYPGQLIALLAFAALIRWRVRHRGALWLMLAGGVFLATGAYNPVMRWLAEVAPFLSQIRYPEKFLLLTTSALAFAAALGWQRLLDSRDSKETPLEDFPLALAGLVAVINAILIIVLSQRPDVGEWFARTNAALPLPPEVQLGAVSFFRHELLVALFVSLSSAIVFALHRWRAVPRGFLIPLTLIVLTTDLWLYNRDLTPTVPAAGVLEPPTSIASLIPAGERIFTDRSFLGNEPLTLRSSRPGPSTLWSHVERADPYMATLWGFRYAIHEDFDLMTTGPARSAMQALRENWDDPRTARRILGAWSVSYLVANRPIASIVRNRLAGNKASHVSVTLNPLARSPYRFERQVNLFPNVEEAFTADASTAFRTPHWIDGQSPHQLLELPGDAEVVEIQESPAHVEITFRADDSAALTLARTYSTGWRATVDGEAVPVLRTSLGMMGVLLPAGEHTLALDFREPMLMPAAGVSVLTLVGLISVVLLNANRKSGNRKHRGLLKNPRA